MNNMCENNKIAEMRPCWWMGQRMIFHMWGWGFPRTYSQIPQNKSKEKCTIAILEDEGGKIVNALPEDVRFTDRPEP